MGTETPLDPGQVQDVELVHGFTRTGLVCDTLYGVSFEGQEFTGQLRRRQGDKKLLRILDDFTGATKNCFMAIYSM